MLYRYQFMLFQSLELLIHFQMDYATLNRMYATHAEQNIIIHYHKLKLRSFIFCVTVAKK